MLPLGSVTDGGRFRVRLTMTQDEPEGRKPYRYRELHTAFIVRKRAYVEMSISHEKCTMPVILGIVNPAIAMTCAAPEGTPPRRFNYLKTPLRPS